MKGKMTNERLPGMQKTGKPQVTYADHGYLTFFKAFYIPKEFALLICLVNPFYLYIFN